MKEDKFEIHESGEMYLETILKLKNEKATVRSIDIVEELNFSKSSVSRGVNILKDRGYIKISDIGEITFTQMGRQYAVDVYERHGVLFEFLVKLGVDKEVADADACRIEHVISRETLEAIKINLKKN